MELTWKLHGDGRTITEGGIVSPDERLAWPATIGLGLQHLVAMFGVTFWVTGTFAILLGFLLKVGALVNTIPTGVPGGVTTALYGLVGVIGVKIWIDTKVDFSRPPTSSSPPRHWWSGSPTSRSPPAS